MFNKAIVVIDDTGMHWASKRRKLTWDEIRELNFEIKDDGTQRNTYDHILSCILKDGEKLEADITDSNFSADMLYKEFTGTFPNIPSSFIDNS